MTHAIKAQGICVAVGAVGAILSSDDWTTLLSRTGPTTNLLRAVAFGAGRFVAVGSAGTVLNSVDGTNWVAYNAAASNQFQNVIFGNGLFVAPTEQGRLLLSRDGMLWGTVQTGVSGRIYDAAFGNGRWVAVATMPQQAITSQDGTNWTVIGGVIPGNDGLAFGSSTFVIPGAAQFQGTYLYTSSDAISWTAYSALTNRNATYDITYNNGTFVAVGVATPSGESFGSSPNNTPGVWQSDPVVRLRIQVTSPLQLAIEGPTSRSYRIESSDFSSGALSWDTRSTLHNPPYAWTETNSPESRRFYRAVLLP